MAALPCAAGNSELIRVALMVLVKSGKDLPESGSYPGILLGVHQLVARLTIIMPQDKQPAAAIRIYID